MAKFKNGDIVEIVNTPATRKKYQQYFGVQFIISEVFDDGHYYIRSLRFSVPASGIIEEYNLKKADIKNILLLKKAGVFDQFSS